MTRFVLIFQLCFFFAVGAMTAHRIEREQMIAMLLVMNPAQLSDYQL